MADKRAAWLAFCSALREVARVDPGRAIEYLQGASASLRALARGLRSEQAAGQSRKASRAPSRATAPQGPLFEPPRAVGDEQAGDPADAGAEVFD